MARSNCLVFALLLYRRRVRRGVYRGYVQVRWSHWGSFPHFLYAERRAVAGWFKPMRMVSYVPQDPRHKTCPPPVFKGRVRWGDVERGEHGA